jgi:hypothetical protein
MVTFIWHVGDVALGLVGMRHPTRFNTARLIFALVGLAGNIVIAQQEQERSKAAWEREWMKRHAS